MIKNGILVKFIISVLVLVCISHCIYAEEHMDSASTFLCEYAMRLYKEGNIEDAIHQLKQALLISPHNMAARNYLEKMLWEREFPGKQMPSECNQDKIKLLEGQVIQLQKESLYYKSKINALKETSLKEDSKIPEPQEKLQSQKGRYVQELSQRNKELKDLKLYYENRMRIMDAEIKKLTDEKESLMEENREIESKQLAEIERIIKILSTKP